jgi:hypothetical protein
VELAEDALKGGEIVVGAAAAQTFIEGRGGAGSSTAAFSIPTRPGFRCACSWRAAPDTTRSPPRSRGTVEQ